MTPVITVIIPVYNSEPYLRRCLDSLIGQSFNDTFEVILVDDGSTDDCGRICDDYALRHNSFRVFHTENQGASLARRFGLEQARADYVSFVDSDDVVSPDYLSTLYGLEKRFDVGISACRVKPIRSKEDILGENPCTSPVILHGDDLFHRFFQYEFWGLPGKLYRKELLIEAPFPSASLSEDYYVMTHVLNKVGRMTYTAEPLYFYEARQGSLTRQALSKRSFEEFANVKDVYDFVSLKMPKYKSFALLNAVESAVKLLFASRRKSDIYLADRQMIKTFLRRHRCEILSCRPLNYKVALLSLFLSLGK